MSLKFEDGTPFSIGAAPYLLRPATEHETSGRIHITVSIADFLTSAFVDTGGVYLLCPPEIADQVGFDPTESIGNTDLIFRGTQLSGRLHRLPVTFHAEIGSSLIREVVVFVPEMRPNQEWEENFPCILGMQGCLEFMRFAVDPESSTFYFGEFGEQW